MKEETPIPVNILCNGNSQDGEVRGKTLYYKGLPVAYGAEFAILKDEYTLGIPEVVMSVGDQKMIVTRKKPFRPTSSYLSKNKVLEEIKFMTDRASAHHKFAVEGEDAAYFEGYVHGLWNLRDKIKKGLE